jgi:hypothetical protein
LSITASTPLSSRPAGARAAIGSYIVGMPPPPAQITTVPFSSSHLIGLISKIRLGSGDGTTRRHRSPSCLNAHPFSAASASAVALSYTGPTNFVGSPKAGSEGSTSTIVRMVANGTSAARRFPSSCSSTYPIMPSVCAPSTSSG